MRNLKEPLLFVTVNVASAAVGTRTSVSMRGLKQQVRKNRGCGQAAVVSTRRFEVLLRVGNFFVFFSIHRRHDNITLKVKKKQRHKGQYHKQRKSETCKGMVA